MKIKHHYRADCYTYPASSKEIEKIQERVQLRIKDIDVEKSLEGFEDYQKANAILTIYARVSYEEGFRKGLSEIKKDNEKIEIKNRNKNKNVYSLADEEEVVKIVQKRLASKRMKKYRDEYCNDKGIKNTQESFALSVTIHSFFEYGYYDATLDTTNIFRNMYPEDDNKAKQMADMMDELFGELI